jgi:diguanylate cyclase
MRQTLVSIEAGQFQLCHFQQLDHAMDEHEKQRFDIIMTVFPSSQESGKETLARLKWFGAPIVVLLAIDDRDTALAALRQGAHDYLIKGQFDAALLNRCLRYVTERKRAEETIRRHAYFDDLTGLPNRLLLDERLRQAILNSQREDKLVALLVVSISQFKEFSRTLGHQAGDLLVCELARRLLEHLRKSDTLARIADDEFAVLLPTSASEEGAKEVARKLLDSLAQSFILAELKLDVSANIGIALFPEHGSDAGELVKRANLASATAKAVHSGYAVYSLEEDKGNSHRLVLTAGLRRAIADEQLFLLYQPKIDLRTGYATGVEALVRWQHPQIGVIPPDEFIPLAEHSGSIMQLTQWVITEALRQCQMWHAAGLGISIAVNVSRRNLQEPDLPQKISAILESFQVSSRYLELEITEGALMTDPSGAVEVLSRMNNIGLRLSLDDFGTGYSSLAYLKNLPVSEIKIDKSFVINMELSQQDVAIVKLIIELGHTLGLNVVAEGVENQHTKEMLVGLGCDRAQGYFISRPLPAEEITRWLLSRHRPESANVSSTKSRGAPASETDL